MALKMSEAQKAYHKIKNLLAFTIPNAKKRQLNMSTHDYEFEDGSKLRLISYGKAYVIENGKIILAGVILANSRPKKKNKLLEDFC